MTVRRPDTLTPEQVRADFPELRREMNGKPLVFLDTGATSLKPQSVIDALVQFYSHDYGTVRRGAYQISHQSTAAYEAVRCKVARFLNAPSSDEIVFVRGTTEGLNLLAGSMSRGVLQPGDEIVISAMEHHANIVPWQLACELTGAVLKVAPIDTRGQLRMDKLEELVGPRTKIVSVIHVANSLGTVNPVAKVAEIAHAHDAWCIVDGAQSAPHMPVDLQALGCDFYVCSGHKMLGPTGAGVLWGRYDLLAELPPWQGGGEMINQVTWDKTTYDVPPHRFEAGTPAIAQVIGLGAAIDYLEGIGMDRLHAWEQDILTYGVAQLSEIDGLRFVGEAAERSGLIGFVLDGAHASDLGMILDQQGICIRAGHHCAQPVMQFFELPATARASFGPYTTHADIDALAEGLQVAKRLLS
jgi:cysteine desulfurase / selenocysteine lyase